MHDPGDEDDFVEDPWYKMWREPIVLDPESWERFCKLITDPPKPSPQLVELFRRYRERFKK